MNRSTTNLLTICCLLTCLARANNVARAQEVAKTTAKSDSVVTSETDTPDREPLQKTESEHEAGEVARDLHKLLDAPIKDLAQLARRLAVEVLAGLKYAAAISTAREQEALFEGARVDLLLAAEQKKRHRAELKQLLLRELDRIRDAYKEATEQRRREVKIIRIFLPRLRQLADQEKKLRNLAKETDEKLLNVRRRREEFESERRLAEKNLTRRSAAGLEFPVIPQLELPTLDPRLQDRSGPTRRTNVPKDGQPGSPPSSPESYQELIESLMGL